MPDIRLSHRTNRKLSPGRFYPCGATVTEEGVNFALFSQNAAEVFLLLFDEPDRPPTDVIQMRNRTRYVWHTMVHGLEAGQLYGYRVRGDYNPALGLRFNEHKLLLDPYAAALTGKCVNGDNLLLGYDPQSPLKDLCPDTRDNTLEMPKCIVPDHGFDWQGDRRLEFPLERLIIYEVHLKGFTADLSSGVSSRGTYLGFIEKIPYLKSLGINAVELLPIQEFYVEDSLRERGQTNYWGYNTIGFFAPESSYSTRSRRGCQVAEFKTLVRELHKAGIEVILDVVYNHTGEGNELGPTISFKGIDNPVYYLLSGPPNQYRRYYMNYTGCGNSMNLASTHVIKFVMDSLRYWAEVMHVDGFRFDLASVLGREGGGFERSAAFFDAISQDPVLATVKLIAEPWDLGTYQVGNFPIDWSEWNGRFRDTVRRFECGEGGQISELGWRFTGSADLYGDDGRSAFHSVNFITCHDGYTLHDLVSFNEKHNEANGENNLDGTNDNHSWNCGAEGDSSDPGILRLRRQMVKNYACLLLFSAGTPMILGGDEFLRTQRGNNNAYCQDNNISWFDWRLAEKNTDIRGFFAKAVALTCRYPILQRRKFLLGTDLDSDQVPDITWFDNGLNRPDWNNPTVRTLSLMLDGSEEESEAGEYLLFLIFNADPFLQRVSLPRAEGKRWYRIIDTSLPDREDFLDPGKELLLDPQDHYLANGRSTVVLLGR
ncbi:MAG: glycogen debranching protein GlgX [Acidobacteriia bacterium]|nr:glycogen debranching protein GlgX [Terriglobia bacterium]